MENTILKKNLFYYEVITPFLPERTFTYTSDEEILPGTFVTIPFSNRKLRGLVVSKKTHPDKNIQYKKLEVLTDDIPALSESFMKFIRKLSAYYFVHPGVFYKIAFPPNLLKALKTTFSLKKKLLPTTLTDRELWVVSILEKGPRTGKYISSKIGIKNIYPLLHKLSEMGIVEKNSEKPDTIVQSVKRKALVLNHPVSEEDLSNLEKNSPRQAEILSYLNKNRHNLFFLCSELSLQFNVGYSLFSSLEKKGFVSVFYDFKSLIKEDRGFFDTVELTDHQNTFVNAFIKNPVGVKLLYGVTGSGKTECYLRCASEIMSQGKSILFLVPEIGLTPSMISKLKIRFGSDIAIQHSSLSAGERMSEWLRIIQGKVKIVVGTRSSVFAPLNNLGLIIVDEENDLSFKQETFPKYNGLHAALLRSSVENCPIILGSATPSIESYFHAAGGKYTLFSLPERVNNVQLPSIELVDMKEEFKKNKGRKSIISDRLKQAIEETLHQKHQVLLFLNRRGFAPFLLCRKCGHTVLCQQCSVTMTVHTGSGGLPLKCHYCGDEQELPHICPSCGDSFIQMIGFGTQKIEQKIKSLFPEARIFRADRDTMQGKSAFNHLTEKMNSRDIDILIGTQMIAKGHHFPHLSLVGIVDADSSLKFPDFRSTERTFSQLSQVAGRAGREFSDGKVIIQTYLPDHKVFDHVIKNSYTEMAKEEMVFRKHSGYPPNGHIIAVEIKGKNESEVHQVSEEIRAALNHSRLPEVNVLGPLKAGLYKVKENFRMIIVIKGDKRQQVRQCFSSAVYPVYIKYKTSRTLWIIPDIDPMHIS